MVDLNKGMIYGAFVLIVVFFLSTWRTANSFKNNLKVISMTILKCFIVAVVFIIFFLSFLYMRDWLRI